MLKRPYIASNKSPASGSARNIIRPFPPDVISLSVNPIKGSDIAKRLITSDIAPDSARSVRKNFNLAGVAWNRFLNSTIVPIDEGAGRTWCITPPSTVIVAPIETFSIRLVIVRRPTAPIDGKASPRKPNVCIFNKSVPSILLVACLDKANIN